MPPERIYRIDIDDAVCVRSRVCCPGGCAAAPSILDLPDNDAVPVCKVPRSAWHEEQIRDAVLGCPVGAISVIYQTYRLTCRGAEPLEQGE